MNDLIEKMALAVNERWFGEIDGARGMVRAALKAAEEAGFVLVPKEPTGERAVAQPDYFDAVARAMIFRVCSETCGDMLGCACFVDFRVALYEAWNAALDDIARESRNTRVIKLVRAKKLPTGGQ